MDDPGIIWPFGIRVVKFVLYCAAAVFVVGLVARLAFEDAWKNHGKTPSDATPPQQPSSGPAAAA
jgi:hypothetical protein